MASNNQGMQEETSFGVPKHIGIIMDGNGRWARRRAMPRKMGHKQGAQTFRKIAEYARKIGVQYLTVYAFSTENWKRPKDEVDAIMGLLNDYLDEALAKGDAEDVKTVFIGDLQALPPKLQQKIAKITRETANNQGFVVNIALNYGGRGEILQAVQKIAQQAKLGQLQPEQIDEQLFSQYLYTANQPDPDLIIRPSGEKRTSNFLLWQSAYAEYVFMDILWPDFQPKDLDEAIAEYQKRNRRFGGI